MSVFGIDLDEVRTFLARKEERRRRELDRRYDQACRDAARIIEAVTTRFDVDRVWQWGSLLDRSRFSEISDIDIAVEGIRSPHEFFALLGLAADMSELPVGVIELEGVRPEVARRIRRTGRQVYDRRRS